MPGRLWSSLTCITVSSRFHLDVNVNVTYIASMTQNGVVLEPTGTKQNWGIQEFADLFEVTPRAIRFYEDKGLLSPSRESGSRVFGPEDHGRLTRILRAKRLGFTLDDIKAVLDVTDGNITDRAELIQRRSNFEKVINSLKRRRKDIEILALEMGELCALIDEHLEKTPDSTNVPSLAAAYEDAFREHFSHEMLDDHTNV